MEADQHFASNAASLRAGIAASVMLVVVCFAVALVLSDRPVLAEENESAVSGSAGPELVEVAR